MSYGLDILSVGASLLSGYATYRIYSLEKFIEKNNTPLAYIWFNNRDYIIDNFNELSHFSIINIGKKTLHIRRLRILNNSKDKTFNFALHCVNDKDIKWENEKTDVLFKNDILYKLQVKEVPNQCIIEIMYYDASFEFINIDQSIKGGKYLIKGGVDYVNNVKA